MQPLRTADRDETPAPADPPRDDTGVHDLSDLWRDLGGSD